MTTPGPLTLGTAGHVDHGKTALVAALTGVDTDRLPEERERGISIALGYAPLALPSGRRISLVDVPGHERFVRTMVAGASGIDLYLMVVAADDGVMPQTVEHAAVLEALGVREGVVSVTKADVADPARAIAEVRELLPGAGAVVACSAVTGAGVTDVAAALERVAAGVPSRAGRDGEALLHVDRAFTVVGIGTVVTGTLWAGTLHGGDALALLPGDREVRVRGLQVHDEPVHEARAGQRVAVNLAGVRARDVERGDALTVPGALAETSVLDCTLQLRGARHGERVQIHHGTRDAAGRLADLGDGLWQLRLERPLLAAAGDRVVVRRLSPPDTLGGGTVLDAAAHRHGRRLEALERLRARRDGRPVAGGGQSLTAEVDRRSATAKRGGLSPTRSEGGLSPTRSEGGLSPSSSAALLDRAEARLRAAGIGLLSEAQLGDDAAALPALRAGGRAVRVSGQLYAHAEVAADVRARIVALLAAHGSVSLAEVRDALATSRKPAQAFLEHLDAERVTRRMPDDRRVLRTRRDARTPT
ncbi:MAG TPA: selenocysteine-specific translation elongation factor [Baekduia sp.]|uniref:selenocysteine-specific translation elongation factor n=1 Tax=Baekduia sp. TaxID=2600305 RepID=UPI002C521161|nr:selenocysteine-specific translation elongation factor [Baekduia sp.]HMJ37008.1 selenocysteine-specific translation elongation factor [Baekduia sp.]